jgi:hypothetical protein
MALNTNLAGAGTGVYWRAQDPSRSVDLPRLSPGAALIVALLLSSELWGVVRLVVSSLASVLTQHRSAERPIQRSV